MIDFSYKAYDSRGALVSGEISALDRDEALAKIKARGLIPFQAGERTGANPLSTFYQQDGGARLSRKSAALFYREMAVMLGSELRIEQALAIVERLFTDKRQSKLITDLRESVRQGRSLSAAMRDFPQSFQTFEIALFRNGEVRGDIAGAAGMAAELLERALAVRGRLVSAMIYPAILALAAVASILVVALVLAPTILPMYERGGQSPPVAFAALIAFSNLLRDWWWALILIVGAAATFTMRALKNPDFRRRSDRALLAIPIIGAAIANSEAARVFRTLSLLLRGGAPLSDALTEAADVLRNSVFREHFRAARERVRQGETLSAAIADLQAFPATVRHFLVVGEETGRLSDMLAHAAGYAESSATRTIDRITTALSPILTLVMGLLVGSLIAVVLSAILGANEILLE